MRSLRALPGRLALALRGAGHHPSEQAPAPVPSPQDDLFLECHSQAAWQRFATEQPEQLRPEVGMAIMQTMLATGCTSDFLGHIPASAVSLGNANWRETLMAGGFNPRQRAVLDRLHSLPAARDINSARIYGHEALTAFALLLRGRYPRYLGSEYASTAAARRALFPIPCIDITRSGLPDAGFDIVVSNEVLEHVPDLDAALRDTARILVPGGVFLGTFPFDANAAQTSVKAELLPDGGVRHLAPPEYHGNPADPEAGSLVFQIPGWEILDRARDAGFSDARMIFWTSMRRGITANGLPGIFLFEARR